LNAGVYSASETERVYSHIATLVRNVVDAGYPVVIDGTFLQRRQRDQFRAIAAELNVPFAIIDFVAPQDALRTRVRERQETRLDASEADVTVLEHQLANVEALSSDERNVTMTYDAGTPLEHAQRRESWQPVLDRLHLLRQLSPSESGVDRPAVSDRH
jgi:uncharacterized protein